MKKLGKLTINLEKVMKNEELVNLRGGYSGVCCLCHDSGSGQYLAIYGSTKEECGEDCNALGYGSFVWSPMC
jgi:natural product precursor